MLSSKKNPFISKRVELLKTKAKNKKNVLTKHTFVYSQNMKISKVKISKLNNNPEHLESPDSPQCNPPKARSRTSSNQTPNHMPICFPRFDGVSHGQQFDHGADQSRHFRSRHSRPPISMANDFSLKPSLLSLIYIEPMTSSFAPFPPHSSF